MYRFFKKTIFTVFGAGLPTNACRYSPTCSEYCRQAIHRYGLIKGGFTCLRRLARCHPFSRHPTFDPLK